MKTAIVTGSSGGIGKTLAKALFDEEYKVYCVDKKRTELYNSNIIPIELDITNYESLKTFVEGIDKVDVLINNAGIGKGSFDEIIDVNLKAPYNLIKLVSEKMIKQKSGSIINITSLGAELGFPNNPSYIASKGGLKSMTKSFAYDLAKHNIRVNNVCPSYINTAFHEGRNKSKRWINKRLNRLMIKRLGEPEDLIGAVLFLCSDASSYITGTDIYIDGGWTAKGL